MYSLVVPKRTNIIIIIILGGILPLFFVLRPKFLLSHFSVCSVCSYSIADDKNKNKIHSTVPVILDTSNTRIEYKPTLLNRSYLYSEIVTIYKYW